MKRMLCIVSVVGSLGGLLPGPAAAQAPPADAGPLPTMPKDNPLPAVLYQAEQLAGSRAWTDEDLRRELRGFGVQLAPDGRIRAKIVGPPDEPTVDPAVLARYGATAGATWRYLQSMLVPPDRLTALARALPDGYRLERARTWIDCSIPGEGPPVVNSDSYRDGGADGTGVLVAVIDGGWERLSAARANGDAPASYVAVNYSDHAFESDGWHGTGCLEAVFDHAPGASYRLYKPTEDAHWGYAVDDAIANHVKIMTNSVGWIIAGWSDNSGFPCDFANRAAAAGILFFTSAGNLAQHHYQGYFNPHGTYPDYHDFDGAGDRFLDLRVANGDTVKCFLQWDPAGGPYDLDLYLLDFNYVVLKSSTGGGTDNESLWWGNGTGLTQTVRMVVTRVNSGLTEFELFAVGCEWQEHIVSASSVSPPANSTQPNVITVGAVCFAKYDTGTIEVFSSRGPSNDGMLLPDLVGPDGTTGVAYPDSMFGTSNSTPNVAGAAAALWSADLQLNVAAIRWLLLEQALWRLDWGAPGSDNVFGYGGNSFYDYQPNTLWVSQAFGNVANNRAYPLYNVWAAQAVAVPGGRILFFPGGTYPEAITLDKPLTYMSAGAKATIGP